MCFDIITKKEAKFILLFLIGIVALFILLGCTEMTREQKNLCYSLTTQSYAYVPVCETEKSCFEKTNELFKTSLGYQTESDLYELKNHSARSWFFFNKAIKEIKSLQSLCQNKNAASLGGGINQVKFYMNSAFLELDLAMKKSFLVVSDEEIMLSGEKVDLIKEEKLYDSVVELRQILTELNSGTTNSDTYVSYYSKKAEAFSKSSFSKGYPLLVEKTPFWIEEAQYMQGTILSEAGVTKEFSFPFLGGLLDSAFNYAESLFYYKQNFSALKNFPSSEFMKLYSDLGGNNNSALKRFANLQNQLSANLLETKKNSENLWENIEKKRVECVNLDTESDNFQKYLKLAKTVLKSEIIINDSNSIDNCFAGRIIFLREKKSRASLSLGEELNELKALNNSLDKSINELNFKKSDFWEKLQSACEEYAQKLKETKIDSSNEQINTLFNEAKFFASKTSGSSGEDQLLYCGEMVKKNNELRVGVSNYSLLEAQKKDAAKECLNYLENSLKYLDVAELKIRFEELKKTEINKGDLLWFVESCESIKKQVGFAVLQDDELQQIKRLFKELKDLEKELLFLSSYFSNPEMVAKISQIKEKISDYEKYFEENEPLLVRVLLVKEILKNGLGESVYSLNLFLEEKIIEYSKNNFEIRIVGENFCETGVEKKFTALFITPNPFRNISKSFFVDTKLIIEATGENNFVERVQSPFVYLHSLPHGGVAANINVLNKIDTNEEDSFVSVSNEESLLKRSISFNGAFGSKKCIIKTKIPQGTARVVVLVEGKEVAAVQNSSDAVFVAENFTKETKITVFFYINSIIKTWLDLGGISVENYEETISYELKTENLTEKKISATLIINLPQTKNIQKVSVFDDRFVEKQVSLTDRKIILKNIEFLERESKTFKLKIKVSSAVDFYVEGLKEQLEFFNSRGLTESVKETEELIFSTGGAGTSVNELAKQWEKNKTLIKKIENEEVAAANRVVLIAQLRTQLENLVSFVKELKLNGLNSEADSLEKETGLIFITDNLSESEIARVFDKITRINFNLNGSLKEKAETVLKEAQKISNEYNDQRILLEFNELVKNKRIFDEENTINPIKAKDALFEMEKTFEKITTLKNSINVSLQNKGLVLLNEINASVGASVNLIDWLESELVGKDYQLIKEKFIPPITESRLKKLLLLVTEIKNSDLNNSDKLLQLKSIELELTDARDSIKKQVVSKFNSAIDAGVSKNTLSDGKALLDSNKLTAAFILLSQGTTASNSKIPFEGILPVVAIIVVAVILRGVFRKKNKEESGKKKIILDEWENN